MVVCGVNTLVGRIGSSTVIDEGSCLQIGFQLGDDFVAHTRLLFDQRSQVTCQAFIDLGFITGNRL